MGQSSQHQEKNSSHQWQHHLGSLLSRFCNPLCSLCEKILSSSVNPSSGPSCAKMRIIVGQYVPMRTCSLVCKAAICALVFVGAALNIAALFMGNDSDMELKRGKRMLDDFNDYSVHQEGSSDDFVFGQAGEKKDQWAVMRKGKRQKTAGGSFEEREKWEPAGVFSSNMDPVASKGAQHPIHQPLLPPGVIAGNFESNAVNENLPQEDQLKRKQHHVDRKRFDQPKLHFESERRTGDRQGHELQLHDQVSLPAKTHPSLAEVPDGMEVDQMEMDLRKRPQRRNLPSRNNVENYLEDEVNQPTTADKNRQSHRDHKNKIRSKSRRTQDGAEVKEDPKTLPTPVKIASNSSPAGNQTSKTIILSYSFEVDKIIGDGLNMHPGIFYLEDPQLLFDDQFRLSGLAKGGTMLKRNVAKNALDFMGDSMHCTFVKHQEILTKDPRMVWDISSFKSYFERNCASQDEDPQSLQQRRKRQSHDGRGESMQDPKDPRLFQDYLFQAKESLVPDDDVHSELDPVGISQCLEGACKSADAIAVRSTRLPLKDLESYWSSRKRNDFAGTRILVLLRDPRAIIYKGQKDHHLAFRLDGSGRVYMAASDLCSRMLADIEELERFVSQLKAQEVIKRDADLVMVLKEEDFLKRPEKILSKIYDFIGVSLPKDTYNRAIVGSLSRDVRLALNVTKAWKPGLALPDLINIDRACQHFYKTGYYSSVTTRSQRERAVEDNDYGHQQFQEKR